MRREWQFPQSEQVPEDLLDVVGGNVLLGRLLVRRKIFTPHIAKAFLYKEIYIPALPGELPGMDKAVERIDKALKKNENIYIWGDFDVDGQTSTTLLVQAIRSLGGNVNHYIPIRSQESHGVNLPGLKKIINNGADLVVTCDTGISAHTAVDFARQHGVDVVITDHHELPEHLPDARAVVNPRLLNADHPLAHLPGVGVAFKLAEALFDLAGREDETNQFLDLVALGIIADVALLVKDNRYLAQRGIEVLRQSERLGLTKLYGLAAINPGGINEEHIGFIIGPRLNALGRLSDANKAVDFLTTNDDLTARLLAIELEGLNAHRQLLTSQIYKAALSLVDRNPELLEDNVLVLGFPTWPAGVVGIVASRLVEQFGKPVILLSTPANELARGSARSIEGVNIIEAITTQKDILETFGGHTMAAGLSIAPDNIDLFRSGLSKAIARQTGGKLPVQPLAIDAEVKLGEINLDIVKDIERLAPFGPGNPQPVLVARDLVIESSSFVGRSREHRTIKVIDPNGDNWRIVWWQGGNMTLPEGRFDLAFSVHASTYRGQKDVQFEWIDASQQEEVLSLSSPAKGRELVDFRDVPDALAHLEILRTMYPELAVWAEGENKRKFNGKDRLELSSAPCLAIVTCPPSRQEIDLVVRIVEPDVVFFLSHDPGADTIEGFVQRLAGLVNYSLIQYGGVIDLNRVAAACAQRLDVVKTGIEYLQARGIVQVVESNGASITVIRGDGVQKSTAGSYEQQLRICLAETKAFRKYYRHADTSGLA